VDRSAKLLLFCELALLPPTAPAAGRPWFAALLLGDGSGEAIGERPPVLVFNLL
jgi:hypothetical protein